MNITKGEWKVLAHKGLPIEVIATLDDSTGLGVATINPRNAEANANLIAASPDLYEALKEIWTSTAPKCHDSYIKAINDICGKALAKAEGKQIVKVSPNGENWAFSETPSDLSNKGSEHN